MNPRLFSFIGAQSGAWRVTGVNTLVGEPLAAVAAIDVISGAAALQNGASWLLHGVTSNERYVTRDEKAGLVARQQGLGRPEATFAALIPIRKNHSWWALTQDERRRIFEEQSAHIQIGMKYLPPIARRLHHCRDLASAEPFDFITWFEFAAEHAGAFDQLLAELRASPEWRYVDREVEIRAVRVAP